MKNQMTVQKELFVQGLLAGKSQYEAYVFAHPEEKKKNKRTVENKACALAKRPEIVHRLEELRDGVQQDGEITLAQFVQELQSVAMTKVSPYGIKPGDKLRAMELLAKMLGFDRTSSGPEYEDTSVIDEQIIAYRGPDHADTAD